MVGLSKFAEFREQVCERDGVGENISDTVCNLQECYLTKLLLSTVWAYAGQ